MTGVLSRRAKPDAGMDVHQGNTVQTLRERTGM